MSEYILLPELNYIIIENLDPLKDYRNLLLINKYYYDFIHRHTKYSEFKKFWRRKNQYSTYLNGNCIDRDFSKACEYGYINVAKYLYNTYIIDIHQNDEYIFIETCLSGHLDFHVIMVIIKSLNGCIIYPKRIIITK